MASAEGRGEPTGDVFEAGLTDAYRLRGLKGLWWELEQYLDWPPLLAEAGYTFFMVCYTACPQTSLTWRQPWRPADRDRLRRLAADCAGRGIELCLAINPCIGTQAWSPARAALPFHPTSGPGWFARYWQARRSPAGSPDRGPAPDPPLRYGVAADLDTLAAKCREALALGVRAIALCLDDIEPELTRSRFGSLAAAQNRLVLDLWPALGGAGRLLVAPTYYWSAALRARPDYAAELTRGWPDAIDVFWTGEAVRSADITPAAAQEAAGWFGRPPVVWYNYASNDSFRFALQLPPGRPPTATLAPAVAGLLVNPMRQVRLTRLHALVMGAYLRDPGGYDHERAVDEALARLAGPAAAPRLSEFVAAWAAYPDPRTLPAELAAANPGNVADLAARLSALSAQIDGLLPGLAATLTDPELLAELRAATDRLRLLAEAVRWLAQATTSESRGGAPNRLLARLRAADPEAACDAIAVLEHAGDRSG